MTQAKRVSNWKGKRLRVGASKCLGACTERRRFRPSVRRGQDAFFGSKGGWGLPSGSTLFSRVKNAM